MTTSNIPDGFSMGELEVLAAAAAEKEAAPKDKVRSEEWIESVASAAIEEALAQCEGPMVHKIMALMILNRFITWHSHIGEKAMDAGATEMAISWMRDAGKLQAAMQLLHGVDLGDDDFTIDDHE